MKVKLTENARTVLEKRYLWRNDDGSVRETPEELFERVARAVASVEKSQKKHWFEAFREVMMSLRFLPNSPTLMNAGRPSGQLSACYVLPIDDSLSGIFDSLKYAALIHQSGGGTGFSFSRLRPKGSVVRSTHGVASGPVSFIKIYDVATETIKQGGTRRGANMAVLRVDHPDIEEFIDVKRDFHTLINFNISVAATAEFMSAVENNTAFALRDPASGDAVREMNAGDLFDRLAQAAWECGDPGLVFLDRINLFNPTPKLGEMQSTNPCGEQPLLPFESCNLGSLNLGLYAKGKDLDWDLLRKDVRLCTRFLDNVIDLNEFPLKECAKITRGNRKIGLGVMGFADLLLVLGLPYTSLEARVLGEKIMGFIDQEAKAASVDLAKARGAFPNWRGSMWERLGYPKMRNATVSTVAPTGTISMIAGASSGIEPIFSGIFYRNVLSGARLMDVHPAVERVLREKGLKREGLTDESLSRELGAAWTPAPAVSIEDHVKMQAVFQRFSDSAVSKTINLPKSATVSDVKKAYLLAYRLGCKGITVYRDQSRPSQVLERVEPQAANQDPEMCPSC